VKNRAWIRDVIIVHCSKSTSNEPEGLDVEESERHLTMTVRITKQQQVHLIPSFPVKLLTLPKVEETDFAPTAKQHRDGGSVFSQFVMSNASLATWGYPLPLMTRSGDSGDTTTNESESEPSAKRRKLEEDTDCTPNDHEQQTSANVLVHPETCLVGLHHGYLLSHQESQRRLTSAIQIVVTESQDCSLWKKKTNGQDQSSSHPLVNEPLGSEEGADLQEVSPLISQLRFFQTVPNPLELFGPFCPSSIATSEKCQCEYCSSTRDIVGLDCEMCDTEYGLELTRISLVDFNGVVLLDSLVKPATQILNYRQAYSGMTPQLLDPVSISLTQIQLALLQIISSETILVGHSLENDLRVLKLCHLRCIDTSVIYPHPKGYPLRNKLKYLANEYLGIKIQSTGSGLEHSQPHGSTSPGHSSVEDAQTVVELVKLKATHGPKFGLKGKSLADSREPLLSFLPIDVNSAFFWSDSETMNAMRSCISSRSDGTLCSSNSQAVDKAIKRLQTIQKINSIARSLHFISLNCSEVDHHSITQYEKKIRNSVLSNQRDVLLLTIHEKGREKLLELQRRKTACMKAMSVSIWNRELEEELQREVIGSNLVGMKIGIIFKRRNEEEDERRDDDEDLDVR
jgi:DNA polymerase III epsilon subunit-like protein